MRGAWFWWSLIALFSVRTIVQLSKIRKTEKDDPWLCMVAASIECLWIWGIYHYGLSQ